MQLKSNRDAKHRLMTLRDLQAIGKGTLSENRKVAADGFQISGDGGTPPPLDLRLTGLKAGPII